MHLKAIYHWFLDSLFPLALEEDIVLGFSPETAWNELPRAPITPVAETAAIFAYKNERVRKMVWNIKYKKSEKAVAIAGYALFKTLLSKLEPISADDSFNNANNRTILVPMPITNRRLNERGYNQCHLLVDEIQRLDAEHRFFIEKNLLLRVHHDSRQTLKNRRERLASTKGIFEVNKELVETYKKRKIIVIDDVITTGSTISEAMTVLNNAGFKSISGLSVAH